MPRSLFALWLWLEVRAAGNRRRQKARRQLELIDAGLRPAPRPRCWCSSCMPDRNAA